HLNDASVTFEPETSLALGFGFRCGFLGLLHMEVIQERLEREYNVALVTTAPTVRYQCVGKDDKRIEVDNPGKLPSEKEIEALEEHIVSATIHVPSEYVGGIMKLCQERRGTQTGLTHAGPGRVMLSYDLPLAEIVFGFYDKLKSGSRGYASLDYEFKEYRS